MDKLKIDCENGSSLVISNLLLRGENLEAQVFVKSDWYEANIHFTSSNGRIYGFFKEIDNLLIHKQGQTNFINDAGNFELNIVLEESTGGVEISGVLIKSMMEESRLDYYLESDYYNLQKFRNDLKAKLSVFS